jgi:hypothetical protein
MYSFLAFEQVLLKCRYIGGHILCRNYCSEDPKIDTILALNQSIFSLCQKQGCQKNRLNKTKTIVHIASFTTFEMIKVWFVLGMFTVHEVRN